jgi:hypothetical protein
VLALQQGNSSRCAVDVRSGTPPAGGLVGLSCCAGGAAYGGLERRTGTRQLGLAAESTALKPTPGALVAASASKPTPGASVAAAASKPTPIRPAGPTAVAEPKPAPGARSERHLGRSDRVPLARSERHGRMPGARSERPEHVLRLQRRKHRDRVPRARSERCQGLTLHHRQCVRVRPQD